MDILLLSVTVVSLTLTLIMSATAWRLARQERSRSAARVAALAAAAAGGGPLMSTADERNADRESAPLQRRGVDVREQRAPQSSEAAEWDAIAVNDPSSVASWTPAQISTFPPEAQTRREVQDSTHRPRAAASPSSVVTDTFLGSAAVTNSGGPQRVLVIAACVLCAALLAGTYWTMSGRLAVESDTSALAPTAPAAPLELVSLRHERRGGQLSITGLVRNPTAGTPVERVTAIVLLFDQQGALVTSARADVDFTKLAPGDESPFVVALAAPANVARYRVSFRNDAGVVPHVDRRGQEPIARTLP